MAYNSQAQAPRLVRALGPFTEIAVGVATASTTTLTVTVPQLSQVIGVVATSHSSATAPFLASTAGNVFTMTTGSGDIISWLAWGVPKL